MKEKEREMGVEKWEEVGKRGMESDREGGGVKHTHIMCLVMSHIQDGVHRY